MFKKSLIAAAVMATVSVPAFADIEIANKADIEATVLAAVTKQAVLSFSTSQENVEVKFDRTGDLKQNGFVTLELTNGATFNAAEVRQWLNIGNGSVPFDFTPSYYLDNTDGTYTAVATDATDVTVITDIFKTQGTSTEETIEHAIDMDGKRLRIAIVANGDTNENLEVADAVYDSGTPVTSNLTAGAGTTLKLNLTSANQIFNLKSGSEGSVSLKVGALRNASYTADPVATPALFELGKLFKLTKDEDDVANATALVSKRFAQLDVAQDNVTANSLKFVNLTTNQSIQLNKVKLSVEGDFSGFRMDNTGKLLDKDGNAFGWTVTNGVASTTVADVNGASEDVLEGVDTEDASSPINFLLAVAEDNETAIEAQKFSLKAEIFGADQETFGDFSASVADIVLIDRDGMKFDTITTGTTSANTIFVRDISGDLPETGGKLFVTIVEYDEHGVNGAGEGTVLVDRAELTTTLPSGGAVTLAPADVAAEVGAAITPARQARFVFEVETNQGEVAVKKSNSEGVDIQNGTKGVDNGRVVDFTL